MPGLAPPSIRRETHVAERLLALIRTHPGPGAHAVRSMDEPLAERSDLTGRQAVRILEAALQSRLQDLLSRRLKDRGLTYYTIGSSGHEANAVFAERLRTTDPAFLHYRSGAFAVARLRRVRGETPLFDAMLSFAASAQDPVSGGRHKVLGSRAGHMPPQTSTIASHLPKAVGYARALQRMQRLGLPCEVPYDSIVYCSFGDASLNHATAQAGIHAASASVLHNQPCPILFVCEDNGIGISFRTPEDYVERLMARRTGIRFFAADSRDMPSVWHRAGEAIRHVRAHRRPAFFHLKTVRLMGHAGSDVQTNYLTLAEIEELERRDPLLPLVDLILARGVLTRQELLDMHANLEQRLERAAGEAASRPKLATAAEVARPLAFPDPRSLRIEVADAEARRRVFGPVLPEQEQRPRHMAFRIAQGLKDLFLAYPNALLFGEDVAKKGGVYHVTDGMVAAFGPGRVFNTILDETTILGLAQGMAQAGCLPFPEIQYLAYLHNAIDQLRGEAASLQFFSNGAFSNPMVIRIAGLAYQKGFGGHFHNDNSLGALLEIPGLILGVPARADEAVAMLRTATACAALHGKVCAVIEPIALYMQKDLHEDGDGAWMFAYPPPEELLEFGKGRVYGDGRDLTIATFGNGLWMSLRAQMRLEREGIRARVFDLRWLSPMPLDELAGHVEETRRLLVVDECRATGGGPSPLILADLVRRPSLKGSILRRIAGADSYVPLGKAADAVLVQEADIEREARRLCGEKP
ncbi:MAG: thiamine pyrophosphate-dependent enzyme [Planctomycetota bacterium]